MRATRHASAGRSERLRGHGLALIGPAAIIACVLIVQHDLAFGGKLTSQHVDILPMWTPTFGFLGRSLAAGHIPGWNPGAFAGQPFAADPQSGWTYVPAMLLFSVLSAGRAMAWFIVAQPIMAGLGAYGFLRSERIRRPAATVGGLALALVLAHSSLGLSMPFAGAIAWTSVMLAAASRTVHAPTWPGRLGWIGATALCWGQIANAHLSNGLVMGSAALVTYLVAALLGQLRSGVYTRRDVLRLAGGLAIAMPILNLAVLLPRVMYLPSTTIGQGYDRLDAWGRALTGSSTREGVIGLTANLTWLRGLAVPPGPYLGVLALVLSLAWWRSRRHRTLGIAIAAYGLLFYLLSLGGVARVLEPLLGRTSWGAFYVHEPYRFVYATVLALCLLAGLGAEAVLTATDLRATVRLLAPGAALWVLLLALARPSTGIGLILLGVATTAVCLVKIPRRSPWTWALPSIVAIELVGAGVLGQQGRYLLSYEPYHRPTVDAAAYVRPGPIEDALRQGATGQRYASWLPNLGPYGWLGLQGPAHWGLAANQRSMLFGLDDVDGYNPTQLVRTWTFLRSLDPKPIRYNVAFLSNPPPVLLDLLAVRWVVTRGAAPAWASARGPTAVVERDGPWQLYDTTQPAPLASVVERWTVVSTPREALIAVRAPGFDPRASAVLEGDPGLSATTGGGAGSVTTVAVSGSELTFEAQADASSVLVVRVPYQEHWRAEVDGAPTRIIAADYVAMGVPLAPGRHTVHLTYDDPWIGWGLLGSFVGLVGLAGVAVAVRAQGHREPRPSSRRGAHSPPAG